MKLSKLTSAISFVALASTAAIASAGGVVEVRNGLDQCEKPEYSRASVQNDMSGSVTISYATDATGKVTSSKISSGTGYRDLDRSAKRALSKCNFGPKAESGEVTYIFSIEK